MADEAFMAEMQKPEYHSVRSQWALIWVIVYSHGCEKKVNLSTDRSRELTRRGIQVNYLDKPTQDHNKFLLISNTVLS